MRVHSGRDLSGRGRVLFLGALCGCAAVFAAALTPLAQDASAGLDPTTTTLSSSVNPALAGQTVTFSAAVTDPSQGVVPSGSVVFGFATANVACQNGGDTVSSVNGVADCVTSIPASPLGVAVTAQYQGDSVGAPSESAPLTEAVDMGSAAVSVTSTAVVAPLTVSGCSVVEGVSAVTCPSSVGVTAGAAVSDTGGALPGGSTVLGVKSGTVTVSSPPTATSASDDLTFVDNPGQTYGSGHPGHFTATVTAAAPASGLPTGTITWSVTSSSGTIVACSAGETVRVGKTTGQASCIVPQGVLMAATGPFAVAAIYSGDANFTGGVGNFSQALNSATTKTYIAASPNPPTHGQPVVVSAAVVPSKFGGPPTGGVAFTFTSLPFKVANCTTATGSETVHCPGGLGSVGIGYAVSDPTSGVLQAGTTATGSTPTSVTLSLPATANSSAQIILFTPNATPAIACTGSNANNTVPVSGGDATCAVSAGLPLLGSPFGVVATYSGDASDGGASSHQLKLTAH